MAEHGTQAFFFDGLVATSKADAGSDPFPHSSTQQFDRKGWLIILGSSHDSKTPRQPLAPPGPNASSSSSSLSESLVPMPQVDFDEEHPDIRLSHESLESLESVKSWVDWEKKFRGKKPPIGYKLVFASAIVAVVVPLDEIVELFPRVQLIEGFKHNELPVKVGVSGFAFKQVDLVGFVQARPVDRRVRDELTSLAVWSGRSSTVSHMAHYGDDADSGEGTGTSGAAGAASGGEESELAAGEWSLPSIPCLFVRYIRQNL